MFEYLAIAEPSEFFSLDTLVPVMFRGKSPSSGANIKFFASVLFVDSLGFFGGMVLELNYHVAKMLIDVRSYLKIANLMTKNRRFMLYSTGILHYPSKIVQL